MMPAAEPRRPDPDALLAHVEAEEPGVRRGRLRIFFGATAGVGKTFAMLEAAQVRRREGVDVVVGLVETHGRRETEALLGGLELIPRKRIEHRGVVLEEFDLDAALARKPQLVLLDELAHTNAPGSRHARRWQDAQELLAAGIDVHTTLNVQHLESLNDVVARITHVRVRETVPDDVLTRADEVELVDLPPEELLKRLREGKVYIPQQAKRAIEHFFRKGNLIALRQLALRSVAERVDAQMRVYRSAHGVLETWPVAERIVVGVGASPSARQVVRASKRLADRLGAEWFAVFIETPAYANWSAADRDRVWETLRLAESLGGRTATVSGSSAAALIDWARTNNATKIVVGKPGERAWRERLFGSPIERVVRSSDDIDVYVISGADGQTGRRTRRAKQQWGRPRDYVRAVAAVSLTTLIALPLRHPVELANVIMLYLLMVIAVASLAPRRVALFTSVLSVAAFDFFCVPPYLTFAVSDTRYLPVFAFMLLLALVISTLTTRLRQQASSAHDVERRTLALYEVSRELARAVDPRQAVQAAVRAIAEILHSDVAVLLPDPFGALRIVSTTGQLDLREANEAAVAEWVRHHAQPAGLGTGTLPQARALYVPLVTSAGTAGVLAVRPGEQHRFRDPEQMHLLETLASQIAAALERGRLSAEFHRAEQAMAMSRLRSDFVQSASHQLRAPLRSLSVQLDRLRARLLPRSPADDVAALDLARADAARLLALADDLLDLARLEANAADLRMRAGPVRDVIASAVDPLRPLAREKEIELRCDVPDALPAARVDAGRIAGVVSSLTANAIRHTPAGGTVQVSADDLGEFLQVSVADNGPGIPLEDQAGIFERFTQAGGTRGEGSGLGLAIAREVVRAHGGTIWVDSGPGPGAVFSFTLPVAAPGAAS